MIIRLLDKGFHPSVLIDGSPLTCNSILLTTGGGTAKIEVESDIINFSAWGKAIMTLDKKEGIIRTFEVESFTEPESIEWD